MLEAATTGAALFTAPATVDVRYVGPLHEKKDNITYAKGRVWPGTGTVLAVPPADARRLLKHPTVWRRADEDWQAPTWRPRLSDEDIGKALRTGDFGKLNHYAPQLLAQIKPKGDVLDGHLQVLALSLLTGPTPSVKKGLTVAAPLLQAYRPLLEALRVIERQHADREEVREHLSELAAAAPVA